MLLIRHAWAGNRDEWQGDDRLRPLDERGRRQAEALVEQLATFAIERICSSPYVRCVQTLQPLAAARGLAIEERDELGEKRQLSDGATLLRELVDSAAAVCVHGGAETALLPAGAKFPKGGAWLLTRGEPPRYLPPPT